MAAHMGQNDGTTRRTRQRYKPSHQRERGRRRYKYASVPGPSHMNGLQGSSSPATSESRPPTPPFICRRSRPFRFHKRLITNAVRSVAYQSSDKAARPRRSDLQVLDACPIEARREPHAISRDSDQSIQRMKQSGRGSDRVVCRLAQPAWRAWCGFTCLPVPGEEELSPCVPFGL